MKKDTGIRFLAIAPIPLAFWFIGGFLCPIGKKLALQLDGAGGEQPLLTTYVMRLSTSELALPLHGVVGIVIAVLLVGAGRHEKLRPAFPLVLSLVWGIIFLYVSFYMIGMVLPFLYFIQTL